MNRNVIAYVLVPVLALAAGVFVLQYRAGIAEKESREFCAAVLVGMPAKDVAMQALKAGFTVNDAGEAADTLLVSKTVYTSARELFGCLIRRDSAGKVVEARPEHRVVPD